jgi:hypothetical protein
VEADPLKTLPRFCAAALKIDLRTRATGTAS